MPNGDAGQALDAMLIGHLEPAMPEMRHQDAQTMTAVAHETPSMAGGVSVDGVSASQAVSCLVSLLQSCAFPSPRSLDELATMPDAQKVSLVRDIALYVAAL